MRRQKACVIWHPMNPRALISTHTEVSSLQKSNWRWQPPPRHWDLGWVLHGSLWSISLGTIQGMAGTISKKPVSLLWAGGRFGWPRLPILARRWPRVDSEPLGKCDLLFHSILHGPVSERAFVPRHGAGGEQWSSGYFSGSLIHQPGFYAGDQCQGGYPCPPGLPHLPQMEHGALPALPPSGLGNTEDWKHFNKTQRQWGMLPPHSHP